MTQSGEFHARLKAMNYESLKPVCEQFRTENNSPIRNQQPSPMGPDAWQNAAWFPLQTVSSSGQAGVASAGASAPYVGGEWRVERGQVLGQG